jgi:hypothetical protein
MTIQTPELRQTSDGWFFWTLTDVEFRKDGHYVVFRNRSSKKDIFFMTPYLLRSAADVTDPDNKLSLGDRVMHWARRGTVIDLSPGFISIKWDGDPINEAVARDRYNKDVMPLGVLDRVAEAC